MKVMKYEANNATPSNAPGLQPARRFRRNLSALAIVPWLGPIITLIRDDQDRLAFIVWPLIFAAIGIYTSQPSRFLRQTDSKFYGNTAYNAKVLSLFFLCLFEIVANSLAPPLQRFAIAACLFLPYLLFGVVFLRAMINLQVVSSQIKPYAAPNDGPATRLGNSGVTRGRHQ